MNITDKLAQALRDIAHHARSAARADRRTLEAIADNAIAALSEYDAQQAPRQLTDEQRTKLVDTLIEDFLDGLSQDDEWAHDIAKDGFTGFRKRSDAELLKAYADSFDENFLEEELLDHRCPERN